MSKTIIGIMGPGNATGKELEAARELGRLVAKEGWVLLTGGRSTGVMEAASAGAKEEGGLTLGVLPSHHGRDASTHLDIPVITGLGSARNLINVLTAEIVIACGTGAGTASEIMLALKAGTPVILLHQHPSLARYLEHLSNRYPEYREIIHISSSPAGTITLAKALLNS